MKVTFLGTSGWYDTLAGNTCSVLVQSEHFDIIFDAGNGFAKADRYLDQEKPVFLFISHYHLDHVVGLHTLSRFRFRHPLCICGQTGIGRVLGSLVREPFTVPLEQLPFPVVFTDLPEGTHHLPFPVECLPLVHPVPCIGYRVILDGKTIVFCTDTGYCENAVRLAEGADLLITECGLRPGEESPEWPHLNPETAIRIAREARVHRLVLIHFAAHLYPTIGDRKRIEERYAGKFPGLLAATDDTTINV